MGINKYSCPKRDVPLFLEKIYNGILERMNVYGGTLIGGDLSEEKNCL